MKTLLACAATLVLLTGCASGPYYDYGTGYGYGYDYDYGYAPGYYYGPGYSYDYPYTYYGPGYYYGGPVISGGVVIGGGHRDYHGGHDRHWNDHSSWQGGRTAYRARHNAVPTAHARAPGAMQHGQRVVDVGSLHHNGQPRGAGRSAPAQRAARPAPETRSRPG
ncbi:MAG TPA: hypothetical protein VMV45_11535 [Casimicrobiaceae bacterium]|nr:hypothetical protein [Casimicrobiaceae bacterium]